MQKFALLAIGVFGLVLTACTATAPDSSNGTASSSVPSMMNDDDADDIGTTASVPAAGQGTTASVGIDVNGNVDVGTGDSASARVIDMTVDDWTFNPASISAKAGEKIVVRLKGVEGRHSFAVPELGINVAIDPGETKDVEIPTDKTGTFSFRCFIPCGPGHKDMVGTVTIS